MKKIILVILYKENLSTSKTLHTIMSFYKDLKNYKLVIWDNSPEAIKNITEQLNEKGINDFEYIHTSQNESLSKIYNKVIEKYKQEEVLHIFDQDTNLTLEFFEKTQDAIRKNTEINLFVPYVKIRNKIVSPGNFSGYKGTYWKNLQLGIVNSKNKLAIASGMSLRMKLFAENRIKFDEKLSFYGIDSKFMLDYSKVSKYFYVIDYQLDHDLSQFQNEDKGIKMKRFLLQKHSTLYLVKERNIFFAFLTKGIFLFKSLKMCILYKTLLPLKKLNNDNKIF